MVYSESAMLLKSNTFKKVDELLIPHILVSVGLIRAIILLVLAVLELFWILRHF